MSMSCSFKENDIIIFLRKKGKTTTTTFFCSKAKKGKKSNLGNRMFHTKMKPFQPKWLQKNLTPPQIQCVSEGLISLPEDTKRTKFFSWGKSGQSYCLCGSSAHSPHLHIDSALTDLSHRKQAPGYITVHKRHCVKVRCIYLCPAYCILTTSVSPYKCNILLQIYTVTPAS